MYFTVTVERMLPLVENKNSVGALKAQKVVRHNTDNIDQTFLMTFRQGCTFRPESIICIYTYLIQNHFILQQLCHSMFSHSIIQRPMRLMLG